MKKGRSLTYMTLDDARFAKKLRVILEESNQPVPDDLIDLAREADRAKAPKGKLGRQLEKPVRRARNYSYRGVGRDDGDRLEEYDFKAARQRRREQYTQSYTNETWRNNAKYDQYGFRQDD